MSIDSLARAENENIDTLQLVLPDSRCVPNSGPTVLRKHIHRAPALSSEEWMGHIIAAQRMRTGDLFQDSY